MKLTQSSERKTNTSIAATPFLRKLPTSTPASVNTDGGQSTLQEIISPRGSTQIGGTRRPRQAKAEESPAPTTDSTIDKVESSPTPSTSDESPQFDNNSQTEKILTTAPDPDEEEKDGDLEVSAHSGELSEISIFKDLRNPLDKLKDDQLKDVVPPAKIRSKSSKDKRLLLQGKNNNLKDHFWTPTSSELAERIKDEITTTLYEGNATVRVLLIFFCAAGGRIPVDPRHPETHACAKKLTGLSPAKRFDQFKQLFIELGPYMTRELILQVTAAIGNIFVNMEEGCSPEEIDPILAELRSGIQEQLRLLDDSVVASI